MLFDGELQGKLPQGAAAAVLFMSNGQRYTVSQLVSVKHKDEAEYTALIIGLKKAQQLGVNTLEIKGDSDLIFNQVNGLTPVTEKRLIKLYRIAIKLIESFEKVSLEWISPEQNRPAKSVVKRCIAGALGQEKRNQYQLQATPPSPESAIANLINKGEQATDEDYRQLTINEDAWTKKSLSELRALIPLEVRDVIALQWLGDEGNLAQMYRWHLRGLPPIMACHKVNLDQGTNSEVMAKLPWEEALNLPYQLSINSEEQPESLVSLLSELDDHSATLEGTVSTPPAAELHGNEPLSTFGDLLKAEDNPQPLEAVAEANLSFDKENMTSDRDVSQDTLPSESSIMEILQLIGNLSSEEQITLAQELVKIPEMVNLILKAIADNVSKGNTKA